MIASGISMYFFTRFTRVDTITFLNQDKKLSGWISYKIIFYIAQIIDINIAKFWRGRIFKSKLQADIFQNCKEVGVLNKITDINIANFSRGGSFKPRVQANILKNSKETQVLPYTKYFQKMNQLRMSIGRIGKISASPGETETIVWDRRSYQVSSTVGTNASTNEKHKFYNSTVQAISRGGGYCATKIVLLIWDPWLKPRRKMGSLSSLISGVRTLMCLTKPFLS